MPGPARTLINDIAELIAIPSVSSVAPERDLSNRPIIDHLATRLEAAGFRVAVDDVQGAPGKANLVATLGSGPGGLVLSGHTDTVPCDPALWRSDPFSLAERDGRLYGLGTCDMKSFFALAMHAAREVDLRDLSAPLVIVATADEESSMAGARSLAARGQPRGGVAVIGEPTGLAPIRMHKGIASERIVVTGESGHSSDPSFGRNAMEGMHAVIGALMDWRAELARRRVDPGFGVPVTTLNLGRIAGGDNPNRICGRCELDIDLRMLPGMDPAALRAELRERCQRALEGTGLGLEIRQLMKPVPPMLTAADAGIVRMAESLTGHDAGSVAFATEAPFLASLGMDVVVLGPGSIEDAHRQDEFVELARLPPMLRILASLIRRYCIG